MNADEETDKLKCRKRQMGFRLNNLCTCSILILHVLAEAVADPAATAPGFPPGRSAFKTGRKTTRNIKIRKGRGYEKEKNLDRASHLVSN